jgi:NAD(P)H-hydrate epimerase
LKDCFGKTNNDFETLQLVQQKAKEHKLVIVLKGHHTFIATPGGKGFLTAPVMQAWLPRQW